MLLRGRAASSTDAASAVVAVPGTVSTASLLSADDATMAAAGDSAVAGADVVAADSAMFESQSADGLALPDASMAGMAAVGAAEPAFSGTNSVPEPSSVLMLAIGYGTPFS